MTGIEAFLELLAGFGVRHIFGNPGTTELPLSDAVAGDSRIQYVLGLQEIPVMAMADGFAMASGELAVVNLHACCGLGNAMGMLYNAYREGTPLLVTAGQQDRRLMFEEPILGGNMVGVTRPWTKWSVDVGRVDDLPAAVRRAVQTALTPPTGPVFMALPIDVQMESSDGLDLTPHTLPDSRVRPPSDAVAQAADVFLAAKNPAILAGSRVTQYGAVEELVNVAERLGAPVYSEGGSNHGRLPFPCDHPLYGQQLPLWSPEIHKLLTEFDALLVVGTDLIRQYVYLEPSRPIPKHIRLVQLDENPWELNKNYPAEVAVLGHIKESLGELGAALAQRMDRNQIALSNERTSQWSQRHAGAREALQQQIATERHERPMTPLTLMSSLAAILPPDIAVIEEAVTTTNATFERLGALKNTSGYFAQRGWALGWGLGCAIGVKLAWPDRPVLALLGDGAAMYGVQGLWSAAHYRTPVTFVVCNNAQYRILKHGTKWFELPNAKQGKFTGFDLVDPTIDFVALARSLGVEAHRVADPDELAERVKQSFTGDTPVLFDVPIAGSSGHP